jgi:hypothetical protein
MCIWGVGGEDGTLLNVISSTSLPSISKDRRSNNVNLSKPSGFFTYHHVQHSKILHGARFALSVLYGSQNRQRLLLYTALTDWFL